MATLIHEIASLIRAYHVSMNPTFRRNAEKSLNELSYHLPSGGGLDNGTTLDLDNSDGKSKVRFQTAFHAMDDSGYYTHWVDLKVEITSTFNGDESVECQVYKTSSSDDSDDDRILDLVWERFNEVLNSELEV